MPFIQDSSTPAEANAVTSAPDSSAPVIGAPVTAEAATQTATTDQTVTAEASEKVDSNSAPQPSPLAVDAKPDVSSDAKPDLVVDASTEATKPEVKVDVKPGVTVTKSETVTTPLERKPLDNSFSPWMWLPLMIAMALWLYLRGRNQAARRAQAEAILAATAKKSKKSPRPQASDFGTDEGGTVSGSSGERSVGNSKKKKKDKHQQKKKQQANSGATNRNARPIASSADTAIESAKSAKSKPAESTSTLAATVSATPAKEKNLVAQAPKAIFEPLRKVTAPVAIHTEDSAIGDEESDEREFAVVRNPRPNLPAPVITTPAKVSGGRFEKLNVSTANAGLGATAANRWPAAAAQPVPTARIQQPTESPQSDLNTFHASAPKVVTARGLGAFVKVAKPTEENESSVDEPAEPQAETSRN